jgi:Tfp pilus assembly major pilin PilA
MRKHQQGMTMIGLLCVLALVGVVVYAGIRLTPVYLNYLKVARSMDGAASDAKGDNPDQASLSRALAKQWEIQDIDVPDYKEVEITKDAEGTQLHVSYDQTVPYVANVSLSVHFDKTVKVQ